ncbi:MAG: Rpp14/Pop5 family protein [Nanoarchaeota archaeon]|nr:hypothetical protein [Nanoarchaeota archaeon]MBU1030729.1 hypothetical protein [Nanoarchaeota archaeon]MBU1849197.1 hypothetical protein [Nanoarchaeota archaeon]
MEKIKPLLPTLKEKKRYVVYEVITTSCKKSDYSREILNNCKRFLGVLESAKAGIMHVLFNKEKQRGVVRVSSKYMNKLKLSLMFIKQLDEEDALIKSIGVSGTLRKAKEKYVAG